MKKALAVAVFSLILSGCGFKMVKKEDVYKILDQAGKGLVKAQTDLCSPEATGAVEGAASLIDKIKEQFEK